LLRKKRAGAFGRVCAAVQHKSWADAIQRGSNSL
jgi:hypothetical protein